MFIESFKVESPNVKYTENEIHSVYTYETTELVHENRKGTYQWIVKPKSVQYEFKTDVHVPKLGFVHNPFSCFFLAEIKMLGCEIHVYNFSGSVLNLVGFWCAG